MHLDYPLVVKSILECQRLTLKEDNKTWCIGYKSQETIESLTSDSSLNMQKHHSASYSYFKWQKPNTYVFLKHYKKKLNQVNPFSAQM